MSFFFTTGFGLAWILSLIAAGIITLFGGNRTGRQIFYVMFLSYFLTRCVVYFNLGDFLWVIFDLVTTVLLLFAGKGIAPKACAGLFFIILQFDLAMLLGYAEFQSVAAVADLLGYIILVLMMTAGRDGRMGKLDIHRVVGRRDYSVSDTVLGGRTTSSRHSSDS